MTQKCAVLNCTNRSDNKERWTVMPHVKELSFHSCTDPNHLSVWSELINPGNRKGKVVSHLTNVCSNHFPLGQPFPHSPFPTLYLRGYDDDIDDDIAAVQYVLRDSKNTDHDYPKLRSHQDEKAVDMLTVSLEEEVEDKASEQIPEDTPLRCVKDTAHHHEQKGTRHITTSETDNYLTSHQDQSISVNGDKDEPCLANVSRRKRKPVLIASHLKVNSATADEHEQLKKRKRRNTNRDTDHIYNTRKSKCVRDTKKTSDRDTDHLYNSRKLKISGDAFLKYESNRDTDHMYNMPKTKLLELNRSASSSSQYVADLGSAERNEPQTVVYVDKRVVDKDHMYQHRVRKNRNKSENRNVELNPCAQARKLLKPKGIETCEGSQIKETPVSHENDILHHKLAVTESESGHSYLTRSSRKTSKDLTNKQKTFVLSKDVTTGENSASENEHAVVSTGTIAASPAHSENDSDHVCDDDSRKTGVGHIDHLYVHFSPDVLQTEEQLDQTPCFSAECYKQEHSYANSEEIHYDACVNCSELVRQLIGTIRQQGDHIDELKKQLRAANARNKQLTSLFSRKSESVD